jgi:hypothetical protein
MTTALCGCYYTTQSYNYGKLLNPGEGQWTTGFGGIRTESRMEDKFFYDSLGHQHSIYFPRNFVTMAIDYRLGFSDIKPLGGGLEIGVHVEDGFTKVQEQYRTSMSTTDSVGVRSTSVTIDTIAKPTLAVMGPPTVELAVRAGLPQRPLGSSTYYHNIDVGWIVGGWVDNGWFAGYSGGAEFRHLFPYAGVRLTLAPTNIIRENQDLAGNTKFFTEHHQKLSARTTLGCALKLRPLRFLPDMVIPEMVIIGPNFDSRHEVGITAHVGFRWINGL